MIEVRGIYLNEKGYERICVGPRRNQYVHRVVMAEAMQPWNYYANGDLDKTGLPYGFTVDHCDHDRQHNCIENLLLLQHCIHCAISWDSFKEFTH